MLAKKDCFECAMAVRSSFFVEAAEWIAEIFLL